MTERAQFQVAQRALFVTGLLVVLGACFISRYVTPDWSGVIVGILAVVGVIASFVAGLLSA